MTPTEQGGRWPHSPLHLFEPGTHYMVTASTLHKQSIFNTAEKLTLLRRSLFEVMLAYGWELEAWALFSRHYHFVARSPQGTVSLTQLIGASGPSSRRTACASVICCGGRAR